MTVTLDIGQAFPFLIGTVFAVVIVMILTLLWKKAYRFFASRKYDRTDRVALQERWTEIEAMVRAPGEVSIKLAVIEADKLLDQTLKLLAFPGTSLGERLRFAQYKYPDLRNVWWAHKVRNQLAHEASYHLERGMAKKAVAEFKRALARLGAV